MPPTVITNPRRILLLTPTPKPQPNTTNPSDPTPTTSHPTSPVQPFLQSLTGSNPTSTSTSSTSNTSSPSPPSLAGTQALLPLKNKYYTTTIPIWIDETGDPAAWSADFCTEDAVEVVRAVGGWVVVFGLDLGREASTLGVDGEKRGEGRAAEGEGRERAEEIRRDVEKKEEVRALLQGVQAAIRNAYDERGEEWEGVCLAVGGPNANNKGMIQSREGSPLALNEIAKQREQATEEWEDLCFEYGFEFVDGGITEKGRRNAVGELMGVERVREALEVCDWEDGGGDEGEEGGLEFGELIGAEGDEDVDMGFRMEQAEAEREFMGLKIELNKGFGEEGEEDDEGQEATQVEELERMMGRMMAARDMSAHLPKEQRRKAAAKAVNDMMKTM